MTDDDAARAFSALSHTTRLGIFRMLVPAGPSGMAAGKIAAACGMSPTATSFHLKELERAELISATRTGRYVRYAIKVEGIRALMAFLTDDCCQGEPDLCGRDFASGRAFCEEVSADGSE